MRTVLRALLICLVAPAAVATAQEKPAPGAAAQDKPAATAATARENPLSGHNKAIYGAMKTILLRSAEKMPEESYSFKPTESVRSFGQLIGHIAESQYFFCSVVRGEKNPRLKIEQTRTSKADLIAALKDAFAYCDKAYDEMTDASGVQTVKFFGGDMPRLGVLNTNSLHTAMHYGNIATYLRMKNIVPPSSEPGVIPQPRR